MSKPKYPPPQMGKRVQLDAIADTGSTVEKERAEQNQDGLKFDKIEPAFQGVQRSGLPWRDIWPIVKTVTGVIIFLLGIALPAAWYLSKLDSNVDVLKTSVGEVKVKTEELVRASIQHGGRLDGLEKTVDAISAKDKNTPKKK